MTDHQPAEGSHQAAAPKPPLWIMAGVAAAVAGLATLAMGLMMARGPSQPDSFGVSPEELATLAEPLPDLAVADFSLTAHTGEPIGPDRFDGEWTVLMFVFTNCPLACPGMFASALDLERATADLPNPPGFVGLSVDPANDTTEALAAYIETRGLDPDRWTLASGPIEEVERVLEGLALSIEEDPGTQIRLEDGTTMSNVSHPSHLVLIGPSRGAHGYLAYNDPTKQALLLAKLREVGG